MEFVKFFNRTGNKAFFSPKLRTIGRSMSIQMAAMRRASIGEQDRKPFFVYVDEFHAFVSPSFVGMLSEVRKYKIGLFLAHQYLEQLPEEIRMAVLGNMGTICCFRLSAVDAKIMAEEFYPIFEQEDFINLPRFHIYLKLLIDGVVSTAFSAQINIRR